MKVMTRKHFDSQLKYIAIEEAITDGHILKGLWFDSRHTVYENSPHFSIVFSTTTTKSRTVISRKMLWLFFARNDRREFSMGYCYFFIGLLISPTHSQNVYQSLVVKSNQGYQYSLLVPSAQLISSSILASFRSCVTACNTNTLWCIVDYGALVSQQCRQFEGNTDNLGALTPSTLPSSFVGNVQITAFLFSQYGQPCSSVCQESRYLMCNANHNCECMPHTYWNSSSRMCLCQSPVLGASCAQGMKMCRNDLNYTCLQFNQCGRESIECVERNRFEYLFSSIASAPRYHHHWWQHGDTGQSSRSSLLSCWYGCVWWDAQWVSYRRGCCRQSSDAYCEC